MLNSGIIFFFFLSRVTLGPGVGEGGGLADIGSIGSGLRASFP